MSCQNSMTDRHGGHGSTVAMHHFSHLLLCIFTFHCPMLHEQNQAGDQMCETHTLALPRPNEPFLPPAMVTAQHFLAGALSVSYDQLYFCVA